MGRGSKADGQSIKDSLSSELQSGHLELNPSWDLRKLPSDLVSDTSHCRGEGPGYYASAPHTHLLRTAEGKVRS